MKRPLSVLAISNHFYLCAFPFLFHVHEPLLGLEDISLKMGLSILNAPAPSRFLEKDWPSLLHETFHPKSPALSHWEITLHTWVSLASHDYRDYFDILVFVIAPGA